MTNKVYVYKNNKLEKYMYEYRIRIFKNNIVYNIYSNKRNIIDEQMLMLNRIFKYGIDAVIVSNTYYLE